MENFKTWSNLKTLRRLPLVGDVRHSIIGCLLPFYMAFNRLVKSGTPTNHINITDIHQKNIIPEEEQEPEPIVIVPFGDEAEEAEEADWADWGEEAEEEEAEEVQELVDEYHEYDSLRPCPFSMFCEIISLLFNPGTIDISDEKREYLNQYFHAFSAAFYMLSRSTDVDEIKICKRLIVMIIFEYGIDTHHFLPNYYDWNSGFMYWYIEYALESAVFHDINVYYSIELRRKHASENRQLFGGWYTTRFWTRAYTPVQRVELLDEITYEEWKNSEISSHFGSEFKFWSVYDRLIRYYPIANSRFAMNEIRKFFNYHE